MKSLYERKLNSRVFNYSLRAHSKINQNYINFHSKIGSPKNLLYTSDDGAAPPIRCPSLQLLIQAVVNQVLQHQDRSLSLTMYLANLNPLHYIARALPTYDISNRTFFSQLELLLVKPAKLCKIFLKQLSNAKIPRILSLQNLRILTF